MTQHSQLSTLIVLIVLGAGALRAVWNAMTKHVRDRLMAFALIGIAATLGGGLAVGLAGLPDQAAIPFAVLSAVIHVGYNLALMNSYRLGASRSWTALVSGTRTIPMVTPDCSSCWKGPPSR